MNLLSRFWRRLKLLYVFLLPIRFSIIALVAVTLAFGFSDQGQDIIRAIGEKDFDGHAHWGHIALFLVLLNLLAVQVWFWARQMLRMEPPKTADDVYFGRGPDPEEPEFRAWGLWLPRILGALVYVGMFYAFYRVRCTSEGVKNVNWIILALIAASFVLFLVFVVFRRRWLEQPGRDGSIEHVPPGKMARSTRALLLLCLVLEVIFFIVATVRPTRFMGLGSGPLLLATLALWVPFGSVIVYVGIRLRVPILTFLLVLAVLVSPIADWNHIVRTAPTPRALIDARPTADQKLEQWYERVRGGYGPDAQIPVFIVATEGGGIRAAYWTAAVLDSLQDTMPLFRRNLFAISSVSGGSLGALVFNSLLTEPSLRATPTTVLHERGSAVLGSDFLTPTLASMTQNDLVQRFLPFGFPDRERALEKAWERGYSDEIGTTTFGRGMLSLFAQNPDLPSLFINGTMVETGDRIITSNVRIRPVARQAGAPPPSGRTSSLLVFRNAFDGFDLLNSDIPLSASAGMSARFTYVSPAGRIPKPDGDLGHVVDGGYFENSGAVTAAELVLMVDRMRQERGWPLVPVVIFIDTVDCSQKGNNCAGKSNAFEKNEGCIDRYAPFYYRGTEGPQDPIASERWANEVLSPLRALLATRGARGRQAVGDVRTTSQFSSDSDPKAAPPAPTPSGPATIIEFRLVEKNVPIPLGWVLSLQSQYAIDAGVLTEGNRWARDQVAAWLTSAPKIDDMAATSKDKLQSVQEPAPAQ